MGAGEKSGGGQRGLTLKALKLGDPLEELRLGTHLKPLLSGYDFF